MTTTLSNLCCACPIGISSIIAFLSLQPRKVETALLGTKNSVRSTSQLSCASGKLESLGFTRDKVGAS